jgi:hypothetical protein
MSDTAPESTTFIREAVGVFHYWDNLQRAVDDLLHNGFDRSEISLLAGEDAVSEKLGHVYEKVSELEDDPDVPRRAFVGKDSLTEGKASAIGALGYVGAVTAVGAIVASGGALAWVIIGGLAAGGGGAALGTLLARALGRGQAKDLHVQIEKGGLLLWVYTRDAEHEERATKILKMHGADDVHVHALPRPDSPETNPLGGLQPDPFLPSARL